MEWISVEDRLPEASKEKEVLVCLRLDAVRQLVTTHRIAGKRWFESKAWKRVTHWMPLPEPPQEGE